DMANGGFGQGGGPPLKIRGTTYTKGLGTNAVAEIHFNLGGQCSNFASTVGIDDSTNGWGSVNFQVYLDGTQLYDSGLLTGTTAAQSLNLPTAGGDDLKLVVTDGGDNPYSDAADWANPMVNCGKDTLPPTAKITSPANGSRLRSLSTVNVT